MAGGSGGPPKLDGRNYAYSKARMVGYLEAINPIAWAVTEKPIVGPWNENQVKYGARAKNALFDALSEEIFARVHSKKTSHEIWEALEAIYVVSKKLREEKYQVLKEKLNEFKMLPNELVEQMYARLNVLVEDINALEISPLSTSDIIRKILHCLHKPKYNIVTSLLYEKDLETLGVMLLGRFSLMRCSSWEKLIHRKTIEILHSKLRVIISPRKRTSAKFHHQAQVRMKLTKIQVMRW